MTLPQVEYFVVNSVCIVFTLKMKKTSHGLAHRVDTRSQDF